MGVNDIRRNWWNPNDPNNEEGGYQQEKFKFADVSFGPVIIFGCA